MRSVDPPRFTGGNLIRKHRKHAGLTLRGIAGATGVSHTFVGEVERNIRHLPVERWMSFVNAIPGLTIQDLALAYAMDGPVRVDVSKLDEGLRRQFAELLAVLVAAGP